MENPAEQKVNHLGLTNAEMESFIDEPFIDYRPEAGRLDEDKDWNRDANGQLLTQGVTVRLSESGRQKSFYETSALYESGGLKTLRGEVKTIQPNGAVTVDFMDLANTAAGRTRTCAHDWLVVDE